MSGAAATEKQDLAKRGGGCGLCSTEHVFPGSSGLLPTGRVSSATRKAGHKRECGGGGRGEVHKRPLLGVLGDVGGYLSTFPGGKGNGGRLHTHLRVPARTQNGPGGGTGTAF